MLCFNIVHSIINGLEVEKDEVPYMVVVYQKIGSSRTVCGGVLYTPRQVITAASCLWNQRNYETFIRYGTKDLTDQKFYDMKVVKMTFHEQYKKGSMEHNVVLLELYEDVYWGAQMVYPVFGNDPPVINTQYTYFGWGRTEQHNDTQSGELHKAITTLRIDYPFNVASLSDRFVSCVGDVGGPLLNGKNQVVGLLVGVRYRDCRLKDNFDLFLKLSKYLSWILQHTGTVMTNNNFTHTYNFKDLSNNNSKNF